MPLIQSVRTWTVTGATRTIAMVVISFTRRCRRQPGALRMRTLVRFLSDARPNRCSMSSVVSEDSRPAVTGCVSPVVRLVTTRERAQLAFPRSGRAQTADRDASAWRSRPRLALPSGGYRSTPRRRSRIPSPGPPGSSLLGASPARRRRPVGACGTPSRPSTASGSRSNTDGTPARTSRRGSPPARRTCAGSSRSRPPPGAASDPRPPRTAPAARDPGSSMPSPPPGGSAGRGAPAAAAPARRRRSAR